MPTWNPSSRARLAPAAAGLAASLWLASCGSHQSPASLAPAPAPEQVVNVYNWADNIDPGVTAAFEQATGIKVNYTTFDTQELMETRLLAGSSGFDVVDVPSSSLERLVGVGAFRRLDRALLPNLNNLDPELTRSIAQFDAGNEHAVAYLWGTTAIGYNARAVRALAPDAPIDSWRLVYDPRVLARLAGCGVSFTDARSEVIATALLYDGADANHPGAQDLAAAARTLRAIRPYVRRIHGESQIADLASGAMCVVVTAGTNVAIARRRAAESGLDAGLRYVIPKEGTISWFDTLTIPADAPHARAAYAFIDFMLRPDIAARNANYVGSTTANLAALPLVERALRADPMLYPDAAARARLVPLHARTLAQSRAEGELWTRFVTKRD